MNWYAIRIVYGKELRDSLRDRRTIISMSLVPMLAIPLLMTAVGLLAFKIVTHARQEIPRVMVIGGENSPQVLSALRAAKNIEIVPATADFTNQIVEKRIRAVVRVPPDFDAEIARGTKCEIEIYEYQGEMKSSFAALSLNTFFQNLSEITVRDRLARQGISEDILKP